MEWAEALAEVVDRVEVREINPARDLEEIVFARGVARECHTRLDSVAWISPALNVAPEWSRNEEKMKVLITVTSPNFEAALDPRFGRAAYFLLVDSETLAWEAQPNPAVHASGGAGIKAAQFAVDSGCEAVISGDCGPNAFDVLDAADVSMFLFGSVQSVQQAIDGLKAGKLEKLGSPSSPGHHGR